MRPCSVPLVCADGAVLHGWPCNVARDGTHHSSTSLLVKLFYEEIISRHALFVIVLLLSNRLDINMIIIFIISNTPNVPELLSAIAPLLSKNYFLHILQELVTLATARHCQPCPLLHVFAMHFGVLAELGRTPLSSVIWTIGWCSLSEYLQYREHCSSGTAK